MAKFTVRQGKRYQATIQLNWIESLAGNDTIQGRLEDAGFTDVEVYGEGDLRTAEATWPHPDRTAEMPEQVSECQEVTQDE